MDGRTRARARVETASDCTPERQPSTGSDLLAETRDDEDAAAAARLRYRREPMIPLEPDRTIAPLLHPGERLLAVRRQATIDRRHPEGRPHGSGLVGDLYVTSDRLVHVGRLTLAFTLEEIEEAVLSANTLLLVMANGAGISLDVQQPRLLRVEIATARAAARR